MAKEADDKWPISFLFFTENKAWCFIQIDSSDEMLSLIFCEKKDYFKILSAVIYSHQFNLYHRLG